MTTTINNEHNKLNVPNKREQNQTCLDSAEREGLRPKGNVPNLRFKEFEGEWEKCILGDITENFNLRNKDKIQYPMFSVTNDRGFVPQSEQFEGRDMVGEDIKAYKIIHTNDFAYNPARINVGSIAMYTGEKPCMISSLYVCFKTTKEVNNEWLMQLLKTPKMNYYYNVNGEGGVRVYLFYPNFARIRMSIPKIEEQKKIAKLLNLIDERIATQNKIIDRLQSLIKGIAQKIVRNNKPNVRLAECLECKSSTLQESEVCEQGTYPVYGANGIVGYLDNYSTEGEAVYIIKDGSGVGTVSYVTGKCSATGTLNTLQAKEGYSLQYLYYMLKVFNFEPYKTGMAIPHIYFKDYGKAKVFCPSYTEQLQYARLLYAIDNKLSIEQNILTELSLQKQYLLRQVFI